MPLRDGRCHRRRSLRQERDLVPRVRADGQIDPPGSPALRPPVTPAQLPPAAHAQDGRPRPGRRRRPPPQEAAFRLRLVVNPLGAGVAEHGLAVRHIFLSPIRFLPLVRCGFPVSFLFLPVVRCGFPVSFLFLPVVRCGFLVLAARGSWVFVLGYGFNCGLRPDRRFWVGCHERFGVGFDRQFRVSERRRLRSGVGACADVGV
jgi:hypothetical protein